MPRVGVRPAFAWTGRSGSAAAWTGLAVSAAVRSDLARPAAARAVLAVSAAARAVLAIAALAWTGRARPAIAWAGFIGSAAARLVLAASAIAWIGAAGSAAHAQAFVAERFTIERAQGRDVVAAASATAAGTAPTAATATAVVRMESEFGPILAQAFETETTRIHTVSFDGETFRAATPKEGPASHIVFDPAQRKFVALLPSIRVELDDLARLDSIARSLGASEATGFESLGFAIIEFPRTRHPVEAVESLRALPGVVDASLRLQGPRIYLW